MQRWICRGRLTPPEPGNQHHLCGYEARLKALPATIWSEDWFTSANFSLAQWTCSTCMRNAAPADGCDLESIGCLETEQRFAPPDVIKCGGSFVACMLKFIPCVPHPPVLAPKAARAIKRSDQGGADGIRIKSKPQLPHPRPRRGGLHPPWFDIGDYVCPTVHKEPRLLPDWQRSMEEPS